MRTISIAELKAHLSAELKKVQAGDPVTVLDHKRPVAVLGPLADAGPIRVIPATRKLTFQNYDLGHPGTWEDLQKSLEEERADRF